MEAKSFLKSKTFWFNIVTFIVIVASLFGYNPTEAAASGWAKSLSTAGIALSPIANIVLRFWTERPIKIR